MALQTFQQEALGPSLSKRQICEIEWMRSAFEETKYILMSFYFPAGNCFFVSRKVYGTDYNTITEKKKMFFESNYLFFSFILSLSLSLSSLLIIFL